MSMTLPVGSILFVDTSTNDTPTWQKLTEHNRAPVTIGINRIESAKRMANGTLRKYFIADKKNVSASWSMLPSYSTLTVDGGYGAVDLKTFYESSKGQGIFKVKVSYNGVDARDEIMLMSFTDFSASVVKRNVSSGVQIKTSNISAATISGESIIYTCNNNFSINDKVSISGFESSQFNVKNALITQANATQFTVAKQKNLTSSITEVSASGGTITYIANNTFSIGDRITITGLTTTAFNLTDVKIAYAEDYYFTVINSATGTAVDSNAGGTATIVSETTVFATTKTEPSSVNKNIKFTSTAHKIHAGEIVSITGVRSDATITNVEAHTVAGQVKYTAVNDFATGDYINITGMTPSEYNKENAIIISATSTYFIIEIAATSKFRKSGIAKSILNVENALVESVTANTFTIKSLTANGLDIIGSASAKQIINYDSYVVTSVPAPQEFWDVSIGLEQA